MTTGQRIQHARKNAGLTQRQLGEKMGLSASMIGQWENDLRKPKSGTLIKLAIALNVSYYDLYSRDGTEPYQMELPFEPASASHLQYVKSKMLSEKNQRRLVASMNKLNPIGQEEAIKRVEELTEIPRYQIEAPHPQEASTNSKTSTEDTLSGDKEP